MLRVDLEAREVAASVRDLCDRAPDIPRATGPLNLVRAELGSNAHRRLREEREASVPGYEAEVPVFLTRAVDDFTARVRGRVDGVVRGEDGTITVEEVKTVGVAGERLAQMLPDLLADARLQLRLYAYMLGRTHPDATILARLVLISVIDRGRREIDIPFDADQVEERLDGLLRRVVAAKRESVARAAIGASAARSLRFPYPRPRPHQRELTDAIADALAGGRPALAMAPTGIGKTVSALLSALQFSLSRDATLFFLTAKTTQQALVARTFHDLVAAADEPPRPLHATTLRAKRRMCPPGTLLCHPDHCSLLVGVLDRSRREAAVEDLLEDGVHVHPDETFAAGVRGELCPYALSLALAAKVDLVIGDYNYVYDPIVALNTFESGSLSRKAVVVIDEAHNLFDRAREYYSPFLARRAVTDLAALVKKGGLTAERDAGDPLPFEGAGQPVSGGVLFGRMATLLENLRVQIDAAIHSAAEDFPASIEGCRPARANAEPWRDLATEAGEVMVQYAHYNQAHGTVRPDDPVFECLHLVPWIRDLLLNVQPEFVPYAAQDPEAPEGAGFGVLCVNPAKRLQTSHKRVLGTTAMSATLSPLSYYAEVLGFEELNPVSISLPSPFPAENRHIAIVPTIVTTYRERRRHLGAIARLIDEVVAVRPGHYVAYFPSFKFLAAVHEKLTTPENDILVQQPRMPPEDRGPILERLRSDASPALLLAVMGGVFAEGIDLPGEALIGAMVVSPGLPQVGFERAAMRHYFDEHGGNGFAHAMLYPGMRRVIQSAGRVHRTPDDRGVILLLGRRFATHPYVDCLPSWWSRTGPEAMVTTDPIPGLETFWETGP